VNLPASNYGVVLWATNEATDGYDLRFYSSEYTVDPTKQPKLEIIYSQQAKTVYFLMDHLGSIRATVQDTVGAPVRGYDDYDPWGYILAGRSLANSVLPVTTRNRFTGKERDDEFGVNWDYFGARYYDPQIRRVFNIDRFAEKPRSSKAITLCSTALIAWTSKVRIRRGTPIFLTSVLSLVCNASKSYCRSQEGF